MAASAELDLGLERVGEYIAASLKFARTLPRVDLSRLHVEGWSHGGAGVISWLEGLGVQTPAVAGAVAVYPGGPGEVGELQMPKVQAGDLLGREVPKEPKVAQNRQVA